MRSRVLRAAARARRRGEEGYAAVFAAIVTAGLFMALAAIGVDLSRVYVEVDKVQKAADAAALAGVTYMPNNLTMATATAVSVASQNGFPNSGTSTVTVTQGDKASQLMVTITSTIDNSFAQGFGVKQSTITRRATADYTPPAPMGSPCNTFGNEPDSTPLAAQPTGTSQPSSPFPSCNTRQPEFWAGIEGPETDKVQGDRYSTEDCSESGQAGPTYSCTPGSLACQNAPAVPPGDNCEYRPEGYFFTLHVEEGAVGSPIDVQIYDPAFVNAGGVTCGFLPGQAALTNGMNPYAPTDAKDRYGRVPPAGDSSSNAKKFCPGDSYPTYQTAGNYDELCAKIDCANPVVTSFALRHQTDTYNPLQATLIDPANCIKQFAGTTYPPSQSSLTATNASYNAVLAKVFHQWYSLCSFTPDVAGDYYIQVRTNVTLGGTADPDNNTTAAGPAAFGRPYPLIFRGNAAVGSAMGNTNLGEGSNGYVIRAVPQNAANRSLVSVSGFERMPLLQTAASSVATFNLIRATPNAANNYVAFDFFDPADAAGGTGKFKVLPPLESSSSFPGSGIAGCRAGKNDDADSAYVALTNCQMDVKSSLYDGQAVHMIIPIPAGYTCTNTSLGGCWFRVQLDFNGANVSDFTTWNATIGGDPVRLVK